MKKQRIGTRTFLPMVIVCLRKRRGNMPAKREPTGPLILDKRTNCDKSPGSPTMLKRKLTPPDKRNRIDGGFLTFTETFRSGVRMFTARLITKKVPRTIHLVRPAPAKM